MHNLRTRHPTRDDLPALAAFANTIAQMDAGLPQVTSAAEMQALWDAPDVNLARDMLLVVDGQDNIVGNLSALLLPPYTQVYQEINLHPIYRNRGLEDFLLERSEEHARANADVAPADAPLRIVHGVYARQQWLQKLLQNSGYTLFETVQPYTLQLDGPPPLTETPPGATLRPYDATSDRDRLLGTLREIQQHHTDATLPTGETVLHPATVDPTLVFALWEGNAVVAVVVAALDDDSGRVDYLGVRHQWAESGALRAVLLTAVRTLYQRGARAVQAMVRNPATFPFLATLDAVGFAAQQASLIFVKLLRQ